MGRTFKLALILAISPQLAAAQSLLDMVRAHPADIPSAGRGVPVTRGETAPRAQAQPDEAGGIDVKEFAASDDSISVLRRHGLAVDEGVGISPRGDASYVLHGRPKTAFRDLGMLIAKEPTAACTAHGFINCAKLEEPEASGKSGERSIRDFVPDFVSRAIDGERMGPQPDLANCHNTALNFFTTEPYTHQIPGMVMKAVIKDFFRPVRAGESLKAGDILIVSAEGPGEYPLHAAVYIGGDILFHKAGPDIEVLGRPAARRIPYAYEKLASVIEPYTHIPSTAKPVFAAFHRKKDAKPLTWRMLQEVGW